MCGARDDDVEPDDDEEPEDDRVVVGVVERDERLGAVVVGVVALSVTVWSVVVTPALLDAATGVLTPGLDHANPATSAAIAATAEAPITRRVRAAT